MNPMLLRTTGFFCRYPSSSLSCPPSNIVALALFRDLTDKIVSYAAAGPGFNMDESIDWAIEQLQLGHETPHLLMLAGMSKPVNYFETAPYLAQALIELHLEEKGERMLLLACAAITLGKSHRHKTCWEI